MAVCHRWGARTRATGAYYGMNVCVPFDSYVEGQTGSVTLFEDEALKEVIKLNEVITEGS